MRRIYTLILILGSTLSLTAQQVPFVSGDYLFQLEVASTIDDFKQELAQTEVTDGELRMVSEHMKIWLLHSDAPISETYFLREIEAFESVRLAQLNHEVQSRETYPDDTNFNSQWHHEEDNDHDIDTPLAWDVTTGGTLNDGTDIVVCVIEGGGADWDHEDLIDNHWMNENEIPDNDIDDDGNGYVDDYNGWNPTNETDNIPSGNHGTQVSSMIGAKGNNDLGVTGVNWDVKIMQVTVGSLNEANVLAAYDYPLTMRKLFNENTGSKGALVVATNASWGIDGGDPDDVPLWCAMYDSLGVYGVLNCGATANNNVNIDVVGDLPTACPSDYMVSVTATDDQDVRTFSGYGATTIDVGAPGDDVYMANSNNNYGTSSGTSFASPCVAGIIGLMYSVPCEEFNDLVLSDPQGAADLVKTFLYEGVDPVDNLADECVTGGRVNANTSVNLLMAYCGGCLTPFNVQSNPVEGTDYSISWSFFGDSTTFRLRYRPVGTADWTVITGITSTEYLLEELLWCDSYEVQVLAECTEEFSEWSDLSTFDTEGCCESPASDDLIASNFTETGFTITWPEVVAAISYDVSISPSGDGDWEVYNTDNNFYTFDELSPCTVYDVTILTLCEEGETDPSTIVDFSTMGCGSCGDLEFCEINGDGDNEWIEEVIFGQIENLSGSDNGYGDYTDMSTILEAGQTYPIELTPGFSGSTYNEYFRVWIDWNGDGDFDDEDELAFDADGGSNTTVFADIIVPDNVYPNSVRMRVGMDYVGGFGGGTPPVACGTLDYGEAEDYCVALTNDNAIAESNLETQVILYPNPATDQLHLSIKDYAGPIAEMTLEIADATGRRINQINVLNSEMLIDVSDLNAGYYILSVSYGTEKITQGLIIQ